MSPGLTSPVRLLATAVAIAGAIQLPADPGVAAVVRTKIQGASSSAFCNFALGVAANGDEGVTRYVALKGQRLLTQVMRSADGPELADHPGPAIIVDLATSKTTRVDFARREYREQTLDQLRTQLRMSRSSAINLNNSSGIFEAPPGPELPAQSERRARKFVFEASSRDTGQTRVIAGETARAIEVSVIAHDPGKSLDTDGGWVATGTVWLAPHKPSLDALQRAQRSVARAAAQGILSGVFTETELPEPETFDGCMPEHGYVGARVIEELDRLDGTILRASVIYEIERSAKDYKSAASLYDLLVKRAGPGGAQRVGGPPAKRTTILDMTWEYAQIANRVDDLELAVPAGFKKK
ncbi:MAG TPA: hypothetical protein VFV78_07915 [Vicinamibacterales bacterium]|nr:hypothetical protein [Vicinamibacterales bacterium]